MNPTPTLIPLFPITIYLGEKPTTMPTPLFFHMLRHLFVKIIAEFPDCHAVVHQAVGPTTMFHSSTPPFHANTIIHDFNGDPFQQFQMFTPIHSIIFNSPQELYGYLSLYSGTKKEFFTPTSLLYKVI